MVREKVRKAKKKNNKILKNKKKKKKLRTQFMIIF